MTIAVTAATGKLGTLVIDALLDRTDPGQIIAIARDEAKAGPLLAKGVAVRIASYENRPELDRALEGVDTVLLISGTEIGRRGEQHRNVIDAAIAQGASRLVYTSAPQADTSSLPVAPEHLETEEYLATTAIEHVLLRNNWYTENYAPSLETAAATGSVLTSAGDGRVASAARKDYAEAAAVVLTTEGPVKRVYELAGDTAWSHTELADAFAGALNTPVSVTQVNADEQRSILTSAGVDPGLADFLVATDAAIRDGDLALTTGELSALIGRPTTPLSETFSPLS